MASDSGIGGSSNRQRIAQQRLRIIAGHLQTPVDGDSVLLAAECKAQGAKTDVSREEKTVPRRRYKVVMERWTGQGSVHPLGLELGVKSVVLRRDSNRRGSDFMTYVKRNSQRETRMKQALG